LLRVSPGLNFLRSSQPTVHGRRSWHWIAAGSVAGTAMLCAGIVMRNSPGGSRVPVALTKAAVMPLAAASAAVSPQIPIEEKSSREPVDLMGIRLAPGPVQVTGYTGTPGHYLVAFTIPGAAAVSFARIGERIDGLGLVLERFEVRKAASETDFSRAMYAVVAEAVLFDECTGDRLVVTAGKQAVVPVAVVRVAGDEDRIVELQKGQVLEAADHAYRVVAITSAPPEITIVPMVAESSRAAAPLVVRALVDSPVDWDTSAPRSATPVPLAAENVASANRP
jgi:hypothetical protein